MSDSGTDVFLKIAIAALPFGFVANDAIGRALTRLRLTAALRKEIEGAKAAVSDMQHGITETVPRAEKIVEGIEKEKKVSFEDLHFMFSGWVIYVPNYPLVDTVTKMRSEDVALIIRYFDLWNQVASYEKSYSVAHAKLVELADKVEKEPIRCQETASQMRGCLKRLVTSAEQLQDAADALEKAIAPETEGRIVRWFLRRLA